MLSLSKLGLKQVGSQIGLQILVLSRICKGMVYFQNILYEVILQLAYTIRTYVDLYIEYS